MSGTNSQAGANASAVRVANQTMPAQTKALPVPVSILTAGDTFGLDLSNTIARGVIDVIQSAFVDNRNSAGALLITSGNSNQGIVIPAGYQAYIPLLTPNPAQFAFTANGGAIDALVFFMNVPMPFGMWPANGVAVPTDTGVAPVSGSVASSLSADSVLLAANPTRRYLFIQATQTDLWLNFLGGVAQVDGVDCFKLVAGQTYETASLATTAEIHYYAVTSGAPITVYQG